ncbi:hypothetical protein, partial [Streptococcus parasanguinis]|uniref:hypothetical protein n=1 Tax=Streptococcus parasanguinis TaxID=1318 RepID=UPI00210BD8EA
RQSNWSFPLYEIAEQINTIRLNGISPEFDQILFSQAVHHTLSENSCIRKKRRTENIFCTAAL